ncbi:DUF2927 domain-containing protein [Vibrio sp. D404a]|uniref:DUF2927 domain-containing protein n=1 Tax=unclassified Vibrio TaxID=2614977 RepID=UPI002553018F|nr:MULTISPECIES: DUF2927 domain-containing protein [unclassified Vibrio]MDK9739828.1 DUF2927 domain-containing protein [Vibrio sp. D404a]MDK9799156.1 DUF2927 domain-containing protein [Vibrio sp. D449a]
MKQYRFYIYSLFLACCSIPVQAAGLTWLDPSFVERAFYSVALEREYTKGSHPLAKWSQPIRIWVDHKVGDQDLHQELAELHVQHLANITGFSIEFVTNRSEANVVWVYTRESRWIKDAKSTLNLKSTQHLRTAICTAGYKTDSSGHIVSAGIVIPVDLARSRGKLLACVVEEITQALGLPNDSEHAYPSIFNDHTPEELLAPLDVVLLKLLYEPELQAGMSLSEVKPIVKRLVRKYQIEGKLNSATKEARQAPLYELFR